MNLGSWIDRHVNIKGGVPGDKPAIIFGEQQYSYAGLADGIARLTTVLQNDFGIGTGDRVAFLGNNCPRIIEALFSCARTGAILVPLNWRLAVPELVEILADAEISLLIVGPDQQPAAVTIRAQLDGCAVAHAYQHPPADLWPESQPDTWPCLQDLMGQVEAEDNDCEDGDDNPVLILYTSGTTGRPKGVVLTQSALVCSARNSIAMHTMTADDHILMVLPLFHAGGFCVHTLPALWVGATVSLHQEFDPGVVLAAIGNGLPSLTGLVPAQISALVEHSDWAQTDVSHLRSVTTGSAVVPDACIEVWTERGVAAIQVYGTTETCALAIHQNCSNAATTKGSIGYAARHCRIRIVDDRGWVAPPGQHGEILVAGSNVLERYWRNRPATDQALRGGWFHTGDIGFQRPDGAYVIAGRKAELIISGGENIYPAELEAILLEHPEISEAAVVGQASRRWGEVPVAVVATTRTSNLDEVGVLALFKGRLARFKHPRKVKLVDKLPRNAMGKVEKHKL